MKILPDPFSISTSAARNATALEIFRHQAEHCDIYRRYLQAIKVDASEIQNATDIPYLPIAFFKTHNVTTGDFSPEITFTSSGTSLLLRSGTVAQEARSEPADAVRAESRAQHHVLSLATYRRAFQKAFEQVGLQASCREH